MTKFRFILTICRWIAGVALIGMLLWNPGFLGSFFLSPEIEADNKFAPVLIPIGGAIVQFIIAVLLLKEVLVEWVSYPIRNFFSNIFYPNERVIPPPNYNLARLYSEQERLDEAVDVYLGILKHHPQEILAYIEGIRAAFDADQPATAAKIAEMAPRITSEELRLQITAIYEEAQQEYQLRPVALEEGEEGEEGGEETAELPEGENAGEETPRG